MRRATDGGTLKARKGVIPMATYTPEAHRHRSHVNIWIAVGAVLVLVAAVGAGVLIGRSTESAAPEGLASEQVVAMIDGSLAALRRGDFDAFASYMAPKFVYDEPMMGQVAIADRKKIIDLSEGYYNLGARYYRASPVIQRGDLAAYVVTCPPCPGVRSGIDLVWFDENFKMTHLWTGNTAGPPEPGS
jgi:hypothetical protein